jgi:hypothetical protein
MQLFRSTKPETPNPAGPARGAGTRRTRVWSGVQVRYELSERFLRNASDVRRQAGCRNE